MMKNWYSSVYKAFLLGSIVSFIIYFITSGNTSLGAMISGFSILILTIMLILYIILYNVLQATQNASFFQSLLAMIFACGPFLLMMFVIGFVLYLVIKFKSKILSGHVSSGYATFSNIIIVLLLLQIYLVYNGINTEKFETTKRLSKVTNSILYLYGVITAISSITLFTILNNFSADG
jgi:hypothetical protein